MEQIREKRMEADSTDAGRGETYFRHRGRRCRKAEEELMQGEEDRASGIDKAEALAFGK